MRARRRARRSIAIASLFAVAWLPVPTLAQPISVLVLSVEGRPAADLADLGHPLGAPIGRAECDADVGIEFRFVGIDSFRANLRWFVGEQCDDALVRTDSTSTRCLEVGPSSPIANRSMLDATVRVTELVDCAGRSVSDTFWVLALDEPTQSVAGGGQAASFPLVFDLDPPPPPTRVTATDGETILSLGWEPTSDDVAGYDVYLQPGGCAAGRPIDWIDPDLAQLAAEVDGDTLTAHLAFPPEVLPGEDVAVAVSARDFGENTSAPSEPVCATRLAPPEPMEAGCAATGSKTGGIGWALMALGALSVRRRRPPR